MTSAATAVRVNGVELEYVERGSGVPVVFSHGAGSDVRYWDPQRDVFALRHRFVAYSRRFYGRRSWPKEGDDSADAHVSDLEAIIRRLDAGPVHLVGFSAAIGLRLALRAGELLRTLTIIEPNLPWLLAGDPDGETTLAWWRDANGRIRAETGDDADRVAKRWFELVNNQGPNAFEAQRAVFRAMWLENFNRRRPEASSPPPVTCEQLRALTTPTLAIGAEHGLLYSRRIVERVAQCIPGCRLVVVPSVTHFMSYQQPDTFNPLVLDFIAGY